MGAANGFVGTEPNALYGDASISVSANCSRAQKFTVSGSGSQEVSRIGMWAWVASGTTHVKLAIFDHDAVNDCPGTMVANSESAAIDVSAGTETQYGATYGTKPQVTGGGTYWLAAYSDATFLITDFATGGTSVYVAASGSYPTWPTDSDWHVSSGATDLSLYAVYAALSTGAPAVPIAQYYARMRD